MIGRLIPEDLGQVNGVGTFLMLFVLTATVLYFAYRSYQLNKGYHHHHPKKKPNSTR